MISNFLFAGLHLSLARKPITFAVLDNELRLLELAKGDADDMAGALAGGESAVVAVAVRSRSNSFRATSAFSTFRKQLARLNFHPYPADDTARSWFKTDADASYRALLEKKPLSGRSLEGRIQRALVLHGEGVQIADPMEFFEEITRFKILQGDLPMQSLYASKELDALMAAYVAWLTQNRPHQVNLKGEMVLPS